MKEKAKEKIQSELKDWDYIDKLENNILDFNLNKKMQERDEFYDIFSYDNKAKRISVNAYFHDETMEYKVLIKIGLIEFCDVSFFSNNVDDFQRKIQENLEKLIMKLDSKDGTKLSSLIEDKGIMSWNYEGLLPQKSEGFSLFITPKTPIETVNGSYIIFDYADFEINTDFTIYYNIFRDEFFGESRILGTPTVTYDFDSKNLKELEDKLKNKMVDYLKEIRKLASHE